MSIRSITTRISTSSRLVSSRPRHLLPTRSQNASAREVSRSSWGEFDVIRRHGCANHVFVVDAVFNLPHDHAVGVCRELIARDNRLPWTCYVNPLGFTLELAQLMCAAGCTGIEVGSDSGCDDVLRMLNKGFDTHRIRETHRIAQQAGLKDCHTVVLGTPGETPAHIHRTLDFLDDLQPYGAIIMVWTDDSALLDAALANERRILHDSTITLLRERSADFPRWIIPALGTNFGPKLFAFLRRRGCRGPLWQHLLQSRQTMMGLPRDGLSVGGQPG